MRLNRAVPHIRLGDVNHAKIDALDALAPAYQRLCQQYTTFFCSEAEPNGYLDPCFESPLSQRWQRVAIQHAAGIAQSWLSNYATAAQEHVDALAAYHRQALAGKTLNTSMVLARTAESWWLTLSYDEQIRSETLTLRP